MRSSVERALNSLDLDQVAQLILTRSKLAAVKFVRASENLSLSDARLVVDWIAACRDVPTHAANARKHHARTLPSVTTPQTLAFWAFVTIGLLMIALSLGFCWRNENFIAESTRVPAEVVFNDRSYRPTFRYEIEGEQREWASHISASHGGRGLRPRKPSYQIGDSAEVFVQASHPESAIVNDFTHRWLLVSIFGLLGASLVCSSFLFRIQAREDRCSSR